MQNLSLFVVTVLIWGSTWIAIALQVGPVPVLVSVFYRFAVAALLFFAILVATGRLRRPAWRHQPYIVAQALCLFSCNFICFYNAAIHVPSGLVSVIFSLATIYNAINGRIFYGDRVTGRVLLAAALGVAGVLLLFGEDVVIALDADALKGIGFALVGTLFFSFGNMVSRRNSAAGVAPEIANAWGMAYGALILLALIAVTRTPVVAPPDSTYLAALVYLSAIGSVVGFTTYLVLVARVGPARAAYATVLFPIVALVLSSLYEGYHWTVPGLIGLALTLLGNVVMFARGPADRRREVTPAPAPSPSSRGAG